MALRWKWTALRRCRSAIRCCVEPLGVCSWSSCHTFVGTPCLERPEGSVEHKFELTEKAQGPAYPVRCPSGQAPGLRLSAQRTGVWLDWNLPQSGHRRRQLHVALKHMPDDQHNPGRPCWLFLTVVILVDGCSGTDQWDQGSLGKGLVRRQVSVWGGGFRE